MKVIHAFAGLLSLAVAAIAAASPPLTALHPTIEAVEMKADGRKDTEIAKNTIVGATVWAHIVLKWRSLPPNTRIPKDSDGWMYTVQDSSDHVVASGPFEAYHIVNNQSELINHISTGNWTLADSGYNTFHASLSYTSSNSTGAPLGRPFDEPHSTTIHVVPGWITIIPITALMVIAYVSHQNVFAMFCGVLIASTFINGYNPLTGFCDSITLFMVSAMNDPERIKIILFTFFLSGMIGLIGKSGGAEGMAKLLTKGATDRNRALWYTFILGCIIFFDDYASALIVGNNMRPITDMLFISREKLAFLVHATSSPPASVAPISSWIGFEIGAIRDQLQAIPEYKNEDPFMIFMQTIPTRFYPIFMLLFIMIMMALKRDFGPMLTAERRAIFEKKLVRDSCQIRTEDLEEKRDIPCRWFNAVIPIAVCLIVTVIGLFMTGYYACIDEGLNSPSVADIAGRGSSSDALIWGSLLGSIVAMILVKVQSILPFHESMGAWVDGIRGLVDALLTLLMAWTISATFKELGLPQFVTQGLSGSLDPRILPACVFLTSCFISFSLGSSWGTMSIMFPLAIPLAHGLDPGNRALIVDVISSILTGSIFGDQCSPLADTSILSSLSSACPVKDHIKTQLPYALLVAATALVVGYIPAGYQLFPSWASILIGAVIMTVLLYLLGVPTESHQPGKLSGLGKYIPFKKSSNEVDEMSYHPKDVMA